LGLATVYGAVKQNGGFVDVYSELGCGTTFKISFPRLLVEQQASVRPALPPELPQGAETVLLVEDEPLVGALAQRVLKRLGYKVILCTNGGEALMAAKTYASTIHVLLTDVVMPGMNGRVLAQELLTSRPDMKVLFTSGYTEDVIVHHGVLEQGLSFLGKPYTPQALAQKLRQVLDS
jgi:CheY-like chemotaxis protein